jgi:large subunit ribosomal protein L15
MSTLNTLTDSTRRSSTSRRVGRGIGSGVGKTCGRGHKGQGAREGAKSRAGYEGGQFRTFMKLPIRGFNNKAFQKRLNSINLQQIDEMFNDGDVVNVQALRDHGFISGHCHGLKILGKGDLTKKVTIEANAVSDGAREKLTKAKISISLIK